MVEKRNFLIALIISLAIVGGGFYYTQKPSVPKIDIPELGKIKITKEIGEPEKKKVEEFEKNKKETGKPVLGSPSAPIILTVFEDFQCPFCKRHFEKTEPKIIKKFVNHNLVKIYHRDFPILGERSWQSALASRCANEQNKFWEYRELLYKNQNDFSDENLIEMAKLLNLNSEKFKACLKGKKFLTEIQKDYQLAVENNFRGTPTFIVNDKIIVGYREFKFFENLFNQILNNL